MRSTQLIRRFAGILTGLAATLVVFGAGAPAAFATLAPDPGGAGGAAPPASIHTVVRTVVVGGMPGWQIALIAAGAALVAATAAVLIGRARTAHQNLVTSAA
jgi:hypothetical protein